MLAEGRGCQQRLFIRGHVATRALAPKAAHKGRFGGADNQSVGSLGYVSAQRTERQADYE